MFNFWIQPNIEIGSLKIAWYAIFIMTGVILAVWLGVKEGKKLGIPSDTVYLGVIITVPLAIVGARLWYVLFNIDQFDGFMEILGFEDGKFNGLAGLAIQGGVMVALITVYFYCKKKETSLYRILDIVAPGFLIGQILGRFGNFCNHELYGPIVENYDFLASIPILGDNMFIDGAYRHPVFLYEAGLNLVGLIIILVLRRKWNNLKSGDLMAIYLTWYGSVRIFTESLRLNSGVSEPMMAGPIPVSILTSIIFIVAGISFFILKRFFGPKENYQDILETVKANKFDTILFDLDGTLLNTKPLIDRSFIHTFEHFRPDYVLKDEELDSFFGPTLYQTFSKYSNDEKEIEAMIQYYRDYNIPHHDEMVKPFPGAKDILKTLHKKGYKLGVVSSKKTDLVKHGLELFGLLEYMDIVIGADEVENHKPAPDGILLAKKELNGNNVAYVGDTLNDMAAAKAAGVKAIGVLYIKDPSIMLEAAPDYVINRLQDLINVCVE
ncbi:MAG: prolipoprotein diacylglyceryl transferase [Acholeplasmatales bacterium]|nr:prolipoprotein diacylglyceryl transferase [Acholeplasmatales bacterium]